MKKTAIIATIGPASEQPAILETLIKSGVKMARLNFSHGSFAEHGARIKNIRIIEKKLKTRIKIIQDLCGPKLRLGEFEDRHVDAGQKVKFGKAGIPVQKPIWNWVKPGQVILIDDGAVELAVSKVSKFGLDAKVVVPGMIKNKKGVSLPGVRVDLPSLSDKDVSDLEFGIANKVDFIALSFVKDAKDILDLRQRISKLTDKKIDIVAKIETVEALQNIKSIIQTADIIMVARGDLALNIDQHMVPVYQKSIIKLCKKYNKPVIVATQMLESMISNPRPTRAEVSDVANAVMDGADGVMLSGETAFGKYPAITVRTMANIIEQTENSAIYKSDKKGLLIPA